MMERLSVAAPALQSASFSLTGYNSSAALAWGTYPRPTLASVINIEERALGLPSGPNIPTRHKLNSSKRPQRLVMSHALRMTVSL